MNVRVQGYRADIEKFRRDLTNASSGGGGSYQNDRDALFSGGDSFEGQNYNQRSRLLDNEQTLGRTSDRISNAQRIGEESEAIGAGVL